MNIKQRINIVVKNIDLINKQVKENKTKALNMGKLYNMCISHSDCPTIALFEAAFDEWYEENKNLLNAL